MTAGPPAPFYFRPETPHRQQLPALEPLLPTGMWLALCAGIITLVSVLFIVAAGTINTPPAVCRHDTSSAATHHG